MGKFLSILGDMKKVKSWVRVMVTYAAAAFIFPGGIALMIVCLTTKEVYNLETVKDLYLTIFPVATGIVTYWFATRSNTSDTNNTPSGDSDKTADSDNSPHNQ